MELIIYAYRREIRPEHLADIPETHHSLITGAYYEAFIYGVRKSSALCPVVYTVQAQPVVHVQGQKNGSLDTMLEMLSLELQLHRATRFKMVREAPDLTDFATGDQGIFRGEANLLEEGEYDQIADVLLQLCDQK